MSMHISSVVEKGYSMVKTVADNKQSNENFFKQEENVKPKKTGTAGATWAAIGAGTAAATVSSVASIPIIKGFTNISRNLSPENIAKVNEAADKIITNTTNLGQKGVKLVDKILSVKLTELPDMIEGLLGNTSLAISEGYNAAFIPKKTFHGSEIGNIITINRDKLSLASFHEIGHAFNYNNSSFWKAMQKSRSWCMVIAGALALIPAITKESKSENGEELTAGQKFKNKLRNISPLLAFGAMTPMLAEEAMASIRGCKFAKPLLDKNLYSKVVKTNVTAYGSYLATAAGMALFAIVAKAVKDKMVDKKRQKQL